MAAHQGESLHSSANGVTRAPTAAGAGTIKSARNGMTDGHHQQESHKKLEISGMTTDGKVEPDTLTRGEDNRLLEECFALENKMNAFLSEKEDQLSPRLQSVQRQVRTAMKVIGEALEKWRLFTCRQARFITMDQASVFGLDELSLSYNGGKDCLVLLILLLASLPSAYRNRNKHTRNGSSAIQSDIMTMKAKSWPKSLQSIYVVSSHPFPEVDTFVSRTTEQYSLDLSWKRMGMKAALQSYLDERPRVKAVFVGTRRTDPHGEKLTHFDMTDGDWPRFMRVHPVIDWHYADIWAFIRHLDIPYCSLYDQGYTSLGGTTDTHRNPALKVTSNTTLTAGDDSKGEGGFKPAYELYEDKAERLGRDG